MDGSVSNLESALNSQINVLRAWVQVAQREQQHLIVVEPEGIHACVEERQQLMAPLKEAIDDVNATLADTRRYLGLRDNQARTVTGMLRHLEPGYRQRIKERSDCLASLGQALMELNTVNMLHARRGLKIVQDYTVLLTGGQGTLTAPNDGYTKLGRMQAPLLASHLARRI
jgi:flagellar biosynthesis/type III secretory pathway chaperone